MQYFAIQNEISEICFTLHQQILSHLLLSHTCRNAPKIYIKKMKLKFKIKKNIFLYSQN